MLPQNPPAKNESNESPLDRERIERDIGFLRERISAMRAQPRPNNQLIEHYEGMLRGRTAVLNWLMDGQQDIELPKQQQH